MIKKRLLYRKNFFPTLVIDLGLWLALAGIIWFTNPESAWTVIAFFTLLFLSVGILATLVLASTRRGGLITVALTGYVALRFFGLDSLLNVALAGVLLILIEVFYSISR